MDLFGGNGVDDPAAKLAGKVLLHLKDIATLRRSALTIYAGLNDPRGFILQPAQPTRPIRFAVGEPGCRSTVWRVWANKNKSDVYMASRRSAGLFKVSLHESGDWRMQWVGKERGTAFYKSYDGDYESSGRIMHQWPRPASTAPGWTDALSLLIPSADVVDVPGDPEPAAGTQWISSPGRDRVTEFRLLLAASSSHLMNMAPAMADEHSSLDFVNGFRLISGESLLIFAVDNPLTGDRLSRLNRLRARERRGSPGSFDLRPASGAKAAVIDVDPDGYRSIWDLSLVQAADRGRPASRPGRRR